MPPKTQTPAPIDRPLSRAYLREFGGWSTSYPPGVSEPTTLRLMENVMINRDGSCRVRPGLRYLSYLVSPVLEDGIPGTTTYPTTSCVGTHEPFFDAAGEKAYLYAVREANGTVGFRVLQDTSAGQVEQTLAQAGFSVPQTEAVLNFTGATTYVKYLQIDNSIFALSNAGETMRLFTVGEQKLAKRLSSIERPLWEVSDKLTVVHPDAAWITSGTPTSTRTNRLLNPSLAVSTQDWAVSGADTTMERSADFAFTGTYSLKVSSLPERTNFIEYPAHNPAGTGTTGWSTSVSDSDADDVPLSVVSDAIKLTINSGAESGWCYSSLFPFNAGDELIASYDLLAGSTNMDQVGMMVRWYDDNGGYLSDRLSLLNNGNVSAARKYSTVSRTAPAGTAHARIFIQGFRDLNQSMSANCTMLFKNVLVNLSGTPTTFFSGASGADYFWTGTTNASSSVYHPPKDVKVKTSVVVSAGGYAAGFYMRAATTVRTCTLNLDSYGPGDVSLATDAGAGTADVSGGWQRVTNLVTAPAGTSYVLATMKVAAVPRGEYHYLDSGLFEDGGTLGAYFTGGTPNTSTLRYSWLGTEHLSASKEETLSGALVNPTAETPTVDTLKSNSATTNVYSAAFFYTFSNEIGESAVSQVTVVRVQRPWSAWRWETANANGEPSGTATLDPLVAADQLVAYMPSGVFDAAIAAGAIKWSLYMFTWSDQDPTPVSAVKIGSHLLTSTSVYGADSWIQATPDQSVSNETSIVPSLSGRYNSSNPSSGAQGLVAADRMVLVHDPAAPAQIRWSSNQQGSYSDFSPSKGGGYKTLTSGNLFIPAVVKLWQNPQSADSLVILCQGVDGYSTGYYMAPAEISSQSESLVIMGFEETTATPGTVSPFGCEVMNNALYHPLDDQLMKSVASNYNINHTSMTDMIENVWRALASKDHIVSSQLDNRIYYLVHNPAGEPLEAGCWGNEVWVFDGMQKQGTWSRWLTQGQSLRKIEVLGRIVMSLGHPSGIFYFDERSSTDEYVEVADSTVLSRDIPWLLETNTQGANRAHDAPAHLRQLNIGLGNFLGQLRYGVRGWDLEGKAVDVSKIVRDQGEASTFTWDLEDFLAVRKYMKEWFFYAESVVEADVLQHSEGQISLVQYRYTPASVNDGYAHGQIETFEYGRASATADARTTDSGVPMPYIDTRRP